MGDGVNIAARLEGVAKLGAICLSEDAYRQVKQRLDLKVSDLGPTQQEPSEWSISLPCLMSSSIATLDTTATAQISGERLDLRLVFLLIPPGNGEISLDCPRRSDGRRHRRQ